MTIQVNVFVDVQIVQNQIHLQIGCYAAVDRKLRCFF